ncbi:MAG: DUF1961 family protein [Verrucomicrobiota bacterium]
MNFSAEALIYDNPLATPADIEGWRMEGDGVSSFPLGRMRMEGTRDPEEGQAANIVHWCPEPLPDYIRISFDFYPIQEPGLCILFLAAKGRNGEDVLDPSLAERNGPYNQYHHGDINALHVSYYRLKHPSERALLMCNLRKSYGHHMVAQAASPIPPVALARPPYRVAVTKAGPHFQIHIGQGDHPDLRVLDWTDDGQSYGPVLTSGKIGFRQMTPMIAEYANLKVHRVTET